MEADEQACQGRHMLEFRLLLMLVPEVLPVNQHQENVWKNGIRNTQNHL